MDFSSFNFFLPRYESLKTYATVSKDSAEMVDFRLARVHSDPNSHHIVGPQPTENPSEIEFRSLIKDLSLGQSLEQLVRNTATENKFRYRRYKELSGFLRGLMLNFPTITSLRRYQGVYPLLYLVLAFLSDIFILVNSFMSRSPDKNIVFFVKFEPKCRVSDHSGSGNLQQTKRTWTI